MTDARKRLLPVDLELLERLASGHGISLEHLPDPEFYDRRLNSPVCTTGLDLVRRHVYYNNEAQFEHVLHEIAHIVTAAPGVDYEVLSEEFVLMQYERCLCKTLPNRLRNKVIEWQLTTAVPLIEPGEELGCIANYESSPVWVAGFRRARELGLVDEENTPTGNPATWSKILLAEALRASRSIGSLSAS